MFCPKCKASNEANATVCSSCGEALPRLPGKFQSVQQSSDTTGNTAEYYKAILGPVNQDYYLDMFAGFDRAGAVSVTWHRHAFVASFFWLLYRKMWREALIYFLAPCLLMPLLGVIGGTFLVTLGYVLYAVGIVFWLPMYANALYYNHCKKQIAMVSASSVDLQQQLGELSAKGGTGNVTFMGVVALVSVVVLGILAAIVMSAYQGYTVKTHTAKAYAMGELAASKVSEFYMSHRTIPTSLSETGFSEPLPNYVREIGMSPRNGAVTVTMDGPVVGGKSFTLVPSLGAVGKLNWSCTSEQIQEQYLPQQCRHQN
jgi:type II secretory pathway pseudopilin PulG